MPSNFDATWKVEAFFDGVSGNPEINLYKAVLSTTDYLTTPTQAALQVLFPVTFPMVGSISKVPVVLDNSLFANVDKTAYLPFEGVSAGAGALTVRVSNGGATVSEDKTYFDLRDVKEM